MWVNPQETADLVTFTEETLNGKPHFLCSKHTKEVVFYLGQYFAEIFAVTVGSTST